MLTVSNRVNVAAGGTADDFLIIPNGSTIIDEVTFNPGIDYTFTIQSQKTQQVLCDNFNSQIGASYGKLKLDYDSVETDRLLLRYQNNEATNQDLFLNFKFETAYDATKNIARKLLSLGMINSNAASALLKEPVGQPMSMM